MWLTNKGGFEVPIFNREQNIADAMASYNWQIS